MGKTESKAAAKAEVDTSSGAWDGSHIALGSPAEHRPPHLTLPSLLPCLFVTMPDESFTEALAVHLQRLIVYAQDTDPTLQREVAERLANEAVKRAYHSRIGVVQGSMYGSCCRLFASATPGADCGLGRAQASASAHQVSGCGSATLGGACVGQLVCQQCVWGCGCTLPYPHGRPYASPCAADNQVKMAKEGGLEMLITLLKSTSDLVQRQAAKALANLGVNSMLLGCDHHPMHSAVLTASCISRQQSPYRRSRWPGAVGEVGYIRVAECAN